MSSGKITNNQTSEIKPSESVAEEFEKFTEAVKEKVSSGTSTWFNKTLQKFIKLYERFTENQKITAFLNFDSIFVGKSRNRIKVQPTAVSRRKSKNGSRQKQSNVKTKTLPIRPVKTKRKYDITAVIDSNVPSAKKAGWSMVSNTKHFNGKEIGKKINHDFPYSLSCC